MAFSPKEDIESGCRFFYNVSIFNSGQGKLVAAVASNFVARICVRLNLLLKSTKLIVTFVEFTLTGNADII